MFTFGVLLSFLMANLQEGLQREIALFTEAIQSESGSIPEVSKAAFCKAQKKLKLTAFSELSKVTCETFCAAGIELDIMTTMKGPEQLTFNECCTMSAVAKLKKVFVRFLHINHRIENKKSWESAKRSVRCYLSGKNKKYSKDQNKL
jgi:hypothetical protein